MTATAHPQAPEQSTAEAPAQLNTDTLAALNTDTLAALNDVRHRGQSWLLARQSESGAWTLPLRAGVAMPSVAMTVLALTALADSGCVPEDAIGNGLSWLAGRQNRDGSFGDGEKGLYYRPYCTALALWVLPNTSARQRKRVAKAVDYLRQNQRLAGLNRGGLGFGMVAPAPTAQNPGATFTRTFAMISPTSMAAEGARRVGIRPDDRFLTEIAHYVRSCHNDARINTRPEVARFLKRNGFRLSGDGGIVSTLENLRRPATWTGQSAGSVVSSGISTYQGLSAYLRAGLAPDSPEVASVTRWIAAHYTVSEHAGFAEVMRAGQRPLWPTEHAGFTPEPAADETVSDPAPADDIAQAGRYLYLFAMAQALDAVGIDHVDTPDGTRHAWSSEIANVLTATQHVDGSWINQNPRWLEFDAVLSTAFALAALNIIYARRAAAAA